MKIVKRIAMVLAFLLMSGLAWLAYQFNARPDIAPYLPLAMPAAAAEFKGLRVTFLGVSSLLLDDGQTAILTDGFFTRPSGRDVLFGKVTPDRALIERSLQRAGITRLAAVIAVHSHYDHAMDSPEVARRTGAVLVGSSSTANIGRGWGMAEDRLHIVKDGELLRFGKFEVTVIRSAHFPHPIARGEITAPLRPPVRANAYEEGGSYAVLIRHEGHSMLINGSAGFVDSALAGRQADVVFLGIGGMGAKDESYRSAYWREVVQAVHARRVIPVHWDDFTLPLDQPLQPSRKLFDDLDKSMDFMQRRGADEKREIRLALPWIAIDPFAGLN